MKINIGNYQFEKVLPKTFKPISGFPVQKFYFVVFLILFGRLFWTYTFPGERTSIGFLVKIWFVLFKGLHIWLEWLLINWVSLIGVLLV
jgi:hypothetical protein